MDSRTIKNAVRVLDDLDYIKPEVLTRDNLEAVFQIVVKNLREVTEIATQLEQLSTLQEKRMAQLKKDYADVVSSWQACNTRFED